MKSLCRGHAGRNAVGQGNLIIDSNEASMWLEQPEWIEISWRESLGRRGTSASIVSDSFCALVRQRGDMPKISSGFA